MTIDLNFQQAAVVLPKEHDHVKFVLVGAGGTGSFAAPAIARLAFEISARGKTAEILIVDPDRVEQGNIPRSNFCQAEVGRFKADTLATRLVLAWGIQVSSSEQKFDPKRHLRAGPRDRRALTVLIGCVDNHDARRKIHGALSSADRDRRSEAPSLWWVDSGNGKYSGQVLMGSETKRTKASGHFAGTTICRSLPAPSIVHPDLLKKEKAATGSLVRERLSCPERVRLGEQSLNVNQRAAVEIAEFLSAFLLTGSLRRFASYFDLESGTSRSLYCTPEHVQYAQGNQAN